MFALYIGNRLLWAPPIYRANIMTDRCVFAIVFMLSKHILSYTIDGLKDVHLGLKNSWLRLAARVVA
jgi:hypothetical protein